MSLLPVLLSPLSSLIPNNMITCEIMSVNLKGIWVIHKKAVVGIELGSDSNKVSSAIQAQGSLC